MRFIIYETTNTVNGKQYRGAHVMVDEADGYLGSGKLLQRAIAKYGPSSFSRAIIHEANSIESMYEAEANYVDADWVASENTYNLKIGGEGGWDYINKEGVRWTDEKRKLHSIEMKKLRATGKWGPKQVVAGMQGKKHTEEARCKIADAARMSYHDIEQRRQDVLAVQYPKRGSVKELCARWGVSHTQVSRFIQKVLT